MKNIKYIIRKRALGDVLWIEPVIRQLATKYKRVIVYTKNPVLFENYPVENVLIKKNLSLWERMVIYAEKSLGLSLLTINLDNAYEDYPDMHFLHAYQKKAGMIQSNEYPAIYLNHQEKSERKVEGRYVILHLESFSEKKFRQVFGVNWTAVIRHVNQAGYKVIQVGTDPMEIRGAIVMRTSIRELMSLCHHASYFIGIDSGPSHIAASLQIPSMIFFGAINPLNRHFPELFKGVLMKKTCEYDKEQEKVLHERCINCQWSSDPGTAVCSTYSTDEIISKINQLMNL